MKIIEFIVPFSLGMLVIPTLIGIVLDYIDPDDIWKLDDKIVLTIDESVEVIEV